MKKIIFIAIFSIVTISSFAQGRPITGTVYEYADSLVPIPGVNVIYKGTMTGTITDLDGKYTITVPFLSGRLEFSYIGMITQIIPIEGRTRIDVIMVSDTGVLLDLYSKKFLSWPAKNDEDI